MLDIFGFSIEVYFILAILGLPVFFIWRRIFKNRDMQSRTKRIITWIATIVSTPILYVGIMLLIFMAMEYYPKHDFDRSAWVNDKDERYEYSDDIIDSKMLIGKSKAEVRKILGDDGNVNDSNDWYYSLGFRPELFNIDPDSMEITFKNNKVISVQQHKQ
ncbi:hypothetical protein [Mucilaginibacter flavidus]|uniref:hypothetical protein n=1 Tax=Mucilaginibacter flavidus TaxID=2949309 RepID=UPI00209271BD|nr:hypothetical protein [Mucilaginibacter flavidus]MCO5945661.1 hypothetical protein [Mucilaginibacter flavidus]